MDRAWQPLFITLGVVAVVIGSGSAGYWYARAQLTVNSEARSPRASTTTAAAPQPIGDCDLAAPLVDAEGNKTAARKDAQYVYDSDCNILQGADPRTFIALDYYYGKDLRDVWILEDPSEEGSLISNRIWGADPATFNLIPTGNITTSDEGFSKEYTKDKGHVYSFGQVVNAADPASFVVDVPSQITACVFDSNDAHLKFYRGSIIPAQ